MNFVNKIHHIMAVIVRFPFYFMGLFLWIPVGLIVSFINIISLPLFGLVMVIAPSLFPNNVKDILFFGVLRRGIRNLNQFLFKGI
jgi:hypothetical protein